MLYNDTLPIVQSMLFNVSYSCSSEKHGIFLSVGLMLGQHRKRLPNLNPTLAQILVWSEDKNWAVQTQIR